MAYGNPVIRPLPTSEPQAKFVAPDSGSLSEELRVRNAPKVVTTDPRTRPPNISVPKVASIFGRALTLQLQTLLQPSPLADATIDWGPELYNDFANAPPELKGMVISPPLAPEIGVDNYIPFDPKEVPFELPKIREIPWTPDIDVMDPGTYTKSPKKSTITIAPPDMFVIPPFRFDPDPGHDVWEMDPHPQWDFNKLRPPVITMPDLDDHPMDPSRTRPPPYRRSRTGWPMEPGLTIELTVGLRDRVRTVPETQTKPQPIIRLKPRTHRASKPRKADAKMNRRWLKLAHMLISLTYGTYTEIMDFLQCLAWNSYQMRNGKKIPAMALSKGSLHEILIGVMEGRYDVDMQGLMVDFTFMQLQDYIIGRMSKALVKQAIDSGGWQSPIGPQGFNRRMFDDSILRNYGLDHSWLQQQYQKGKDYVYEKKWVSPRT